MTGPDSTKNITLIRWLTYLMFLMFAMTTESVGEIIKEVKKTFDVTNAEASLMHSLPMLGIALSGLFLGFLADKLGRKYTIMLGLAMFAMASYFFAVGKTFSMILALMTISGIAIGVFKTGALALIGDISTSTKNHTATMNGAEAFFGVGAIVGPLVIVYLLSQGVGWQWLYVLAGGLCTILIIIASMVTYPKTVVHESTQPVKFTTSLKMLKNPYAMSFSLGGALYAAIESAIYVWMPSYLLCGASSATETFACYAEGYARNLAIYALPVFFILRALGRFVGIWMMAYFNWALVLLLFSSLIMLCFIAGLIGGQSLAIYLFPLSGLFMSVIYPTINSKGISCFPKSEHGTVAGVILFFTAAGAAAGPFVMGLVADANGGDAKYGFIVASAFTLILVGGLLYNFLCNPTKKRLDEIETAEYGDIRE